MQNPSSKRAWFQRLKLKLYEPLSNVAFNVNLRRYILEGEDPVREAELNVRAFRRMWRRAAALEAAGMGGALAAHDAMASLEMQERVV